MVLLNTDLAKIVSESPFLTSIMRLPSSSTEGSNSTSSPSLKPTLLKEIFKPLSLRVATYTPLLLSSLPRKGSS